MPGVNLIENISPEVPSGTEKNNDLNTDSNISNDGMEKKGHVIAFGEIEEADMNKSDENTYGDGRTTTDPFVPFDDLPDEGSRIVTIRAMLVGCICGALVNASNVYLGLKTGI